MTTQQPEALRLADVLSTADADMSLTDGFIWVKISPTELDDAASELRRLLSEALRIEALHAQAQRELFDAKAANQELLEALEWVSRRCPEQFLEQPPHRIHWEAAYDAGACARAAIAKHGSGA